MLVDLHCHSTPRSSCSRASLEQLVDSARARGVDALCLTEHDVTWKPEELAAAAKEVGFPLFSGVELTTEIGHVVAVGDLRKPLWLGYRFEELAAETDETGVAIVLVHPVRTTAGERAVRAGRTPPAPDAVAAQLAARNYQDVYASLQDGSAQHGRLFVQDLGADGLADGGDSVDIVYDNGQQVVFDGNPKSHKMSDKAYHEAFSSADTRYARMLTVLINEARRAGGQF